MQAKDREGWCYKPIATSGADHERGGGRKAPVLK